jgi:hypothetical protein
MKTLLSMMLVLVLTASLFVGCGCTNQNMDSTSAPTVLPTNEEVWDTTESATRATVEPTTNTTIVTETTEVITTLYITVTHETAEEMADVYGFTAEQKQILSELLQEDNTSMWSAALYGIHSADEQIVAVAESQIGNVGGEPYWRWYGFTSRVEWCACFVSWCANECGYVEAGVIPQFSVCDRGVEWFQERGQWAAGTATPVPGMIIFYDWDAPEEPSGPQDGESDHVGIVQKVEDGYVYTIEGNTSDSCAQRRYRIGYYEILGYGIPAY